MKKDSTSYLELKGRMSEKKLAQLNEIKELQNQEIERLKQEYNSILAQINETEVRNSQAESILKHRIAQLKSEIDNFSTRRAVLKSHTKVSHSKKMNEQQSIHQDNIMRLRTQYETKINETKLKSNQNMDETTNIVTQIDTTCREISKVLNQKHNKNERRVKQQLDALNERIEDLKQYETTLQKKIDKRKQTIEDEDFKFQKYIEKSKTLQERRTAVINETISSAEEQYQMFDSAQTAEENAIRDQNNRILEDLRNKIAKMKTKCSSMQQGISSGRTAESDEIDAANIEKARISKQLDDEILQRDESGESRMMKTLKDEYMDRQYLLQRMNKYNEQLKSLKAEKKKVLLELKRLDFMVFGKNGQYQRIPKDL